jgi:hypothetical protein
MKLVAQGGRATGSSACSSKSPGSSGRRSSITRVGYILLSLLMGADAG